jgi:hypothetical protein
MMDRFEINSVLATSVVEFCHIVTEAREVSSLTSSLIDTSAICRVIDLQSTIESGETA